MTTSDRAEAVPRIADHVAAVGTGTGFVVAALRTSTLHALDGTAGEIWAEIDGAASIGTIVSSLARRYGEDWSVLLDAVCAFVDDLVAAGLVTFDASAIGSPGGDPEDIGERLESGADGRLQQIGDVRPERRRRRR